MAFPEESASPPSSNPAVDKGGSSSATPIGESEKTAPASVGREASECPPAAGSSLREAGANLCHVAAAGGPVAVCDDVSLKGRTMEVSRNSRRRLWKGKLNKNDANTFTFKLVAASLDDPGARVGVETEASSAGQTRALQRVIPSNALRKNRFSKQLPRELLQAFTPEDFGIHSNLSKDTRRQLCEEIYGEAAELIKEEAEQPSSSKQQTDEKQKTETSCQPRRPSSSSCLSDLDDDCYFPKDGYDYTQHLVPIRGEVCSTARKSPHVAEVAKTAPAQPQEQEVKQPSQSGPALSREERQVVEALDNAEEYEELLDNFVLTAQTDETGQVQPIEGEDVLLWGEGHVAKAEQRLQGVGEKRLDSDWLDEDEEDWMGFSDDGSVGDAAGGTDIEEKAAAAGTGKQSKGAAGVRAAAPTDEDFEKVLEEYADEFIGEVEAEEEEGDAAQGSEPNQIPSDVDEALDDFLQEHKRGAKIHIFTKDFLLRRNVRRLPPQQADAAAAAAADLSRSSPQQQKQDQQKRCSVTRDRDGSSDEEDVEGDSSGSDVGLDSPDEADDLQAEKKQEGQEKQLLQQKFPHPKNARDMNMEEVFKPPSAADVQAIRRLVEQQQREEEQREAQGGDDHDSTDEEMKENARRDEERRWRFVALLQQKDCETILTTRSASSWAPRTIALPPPHILKRQLHLMREAAVGRGTSQGEQARNSKLLMQLAFAEDVTRAGASPEIVGPGKCGTQPGQQQDTRKSCQQGRGGADVAKEDSEEDRGHTSAGSTVEKTPPAAAADETARLVEALQGAAEDIPHVMTQRCRGETAEERRERKKAVKESQRLARELKKHNKFLLKEEEKKAAERRIKNNAYDVKAGVRCVKL